MFIEQLSDKFIKFDNSYLFCLSEYSDMISNHPASDYYLKLYDVSINIHICIKWLSWALEFFYKISESLQSLEDSYSTNNIFENSIQCEVLKKEEFPHILYLDGSDITNKSECLKIVKETYINKAFTENTKVHLKLKINIREFLIISHMLFPSFEQFK